MSSLLRFEFEHSHKATLEFYEKLLEQKQFDTFEQRVSYEFQKF